METGIEGMFYMCFYSCRARMCAVDGGGGAAFVWE
jgi:hypothetical protein